MTSVVYVCKSSNDTENGTRENGTRENDTGIGLRNRDLGKQSVQKVLLCGYVSDVVRIVYRASGEMSPRVFISAALCALYIECASSS